MWRYKGRRADLLNGLYKGYQFPIFLIINDTMTTPWSWRLGLPFESTKVADPSLTWNRKLWGGEIAFARSALITPGRGDPMVSCVIDVPSNVQLTHDKIRFALRSLRFEHPSIASKVVWHPPAEPADARFIYEAPASEEQVTSWLDSIAFVREGASEVEATLSALRIELARADAPRTSDELKLYHITPHASKPQVHGILLYLKHTIFDGVAAWQVLDCVLEQLSRILGQSPGHSSSPIEWGTEVSRLARPVADRVAHPWSPGDLHSEWPIVKRMNKILDHPSVSAGLVSIDACAPNCFYSLSRRPSAYQFLTWTHSGAAPTSLQRHFPKPLLKVSSVLLVSTVARYFLFSSRQYSSLACASAHQPVVASTVSRFPITLSISVPESLPVAR